MKRCLGGSLDSSCVGEEVLIQGWVASQRNHGGVMFINLRDRGGIVQIVVHPEDSPEVAQALSPARLEWVIEVRGQVARRAPEAINPEMPTGEIEVVASYGSVLSPSEPVPVAVDGVVDAHENTRLKYRYLELRRANLQANLRLRHRVALAIRQFCDEQDFAEIETPILTRSTPEGARDYLVPSRVHQASYYALPQSPQLFKQLLMVSGFERYLQIARCFRDEDLRADRQPEFTQVDLEMSFIDEEDVYSLIEGLFERIFPMAGIEIETPFLRMPWHEAMARFGTDKPDLRYDLEIRELTPVVAESGFRAFRQTAADGGVIRGFRVPGAAGASRRLVDRWADLARRYGAAGALTFRRRDGELQFQVKNVLSEGELNRLAETLELEEGDLALIVAGKRKVAATALGALRCELAGEYGLIPEGQHSFLWVTDFPLLEWDEEDQRYYSMNHPFTAPKSEDVERLGTDPGSVQARAYDVVMDGFELGGGSIRIHDAETQEQAFRALGISDEEARDRFGFLLDALTFGAPPHGGIALGLDRIIMLMAGAPSLRDVIAFPKTTSAGCLMTEAPSKVDPKQLEELWIRPIDTEEE